MRWNIVVIVLVLLGITACATDANIEATEFADGETIRLVSSEAGQYSPAAIKVKLGSRVRIEGDPETLSGGMDTVIIDGYGINKLISPEDNIIEFVADKPGVYDMYCANGMGNGKLIVEAT